LSKENGDFRGLASEHLIQIFETAVYAATNQPEQLHVASNTVQVPFAEIEKKGAHVKVLILYFTRTGHALEAANATAEGIRSAGSEADLITAQAFHSAQLAGYDALIVASPCWAGSAGRPILPKPIDRALKALVTDDLREKRCGGISVHAGIGGENTVQRIGELLMQKGCTEYRRGPAVRAGAPFSIWKGPSVSLQDEERFMTYGTAFVA